MDDEVFWTDDDIQKLRERLIDHALITLSSTVAKIDTVDDALRWVQSRDLHPFSFRVCCAAAHLDAERMQAALEPYLTDMSEPLQAA